MEFLPNVPPLKFLEIEIHSTDNDCQLFNNLFTFTTLIGRGGGSYVFGCNVNYTEPKFHLEKDQKIVLKLCDPILDVVGCDQMISEANNLRKISILNAKNICYNFPSFYIYGKCCLFIDTDEGDKTKPPDQCALEKRDYYGYIIVPDILYYYANSEIPDLHIDRLTEQYGFSCLINARTQLKVNNFSLLESMYPFSENSYISNKIHEFLIDNIGIGCPNYIVMSQIPGKNLAQFISNASDPHIIDYSLFFEMIYANACTIKHYNFILADQHDDNIMIADVKIPRVYKLGNVYIMFNTPNMLFYIDTQATKTFEYTNNPIKLTQLYTTNPSYATDEIQNIITWLKNNPFQLDHFMTNILPNIYSKFIITKSQLEYLLLHNKNIRVATYV